MILSRLRLINFRNHAATSLELGKGINAFFGNNGEGKTNILEAISYLGLTKSFYATSDGEVLQVGKDSFEVAGEMQSDAGTEFRVCVEYISQPPAKRYSINNEASAKLSGIIGRFPVVVLSPENSSITFGGPSERRKFVDLTLSQISSAYLEDVLEYRRILRQRNKILSNARAQQIAPGAELVPWTQNLVRYGSRIAHRRSAFITEFRNYVRRAYARLVNADEEIDISYEVGFAGPTGDNLHELEAEFAQELEARQDEEVRRGVTLVGPHRDEIRFTIDRMNVQQFASQGQHKTLLAALKIAECLFIHERRQETPMLLLDDLFSELDVHRASRHLELASGLGQIVVTTTDERLIGSRVIWNGENRRFSVEEGTIK